MGDARSSEYDYGPWADYRLPADRSNWHPYCRRFYDYCRDITPPGRLPGRQHVPPADIVPLLPRVWMLDVVRPALRFRYRLVGTSKVLTLGREVTGRWLDEVHPEYRADPLLTQRYRFMAETSRPTWRRGPIRFPPRRRPDQRWLIWVVLSPSAVGEEIEKADLSVRPRT
jgi:hypothetical protein